MINRINIKKIKASNFLCFGPKGIEIDFTTLGNIILIKGDNLDNKSKTNLDEVCSNGTGKSSVQEIIAFTLFGRTIKGGFSGKDKLNIDDVVNNKISPKNNKCTTEIWFGDYYVVRTRAITKGGNGKSTLKLYLIDKDGNETDESKGTIDATQKEIENLLGLNFNSFVGLIVFTDNNSGSFLESDTATKRKMIEEVLSLEVYNKYFQTAKILYNEIKAARRVAVGVYDTILRQKDESYKRKATLLQQEASWYVSKTNEATKLTELIKSKKDELGNTNFGSALKEYEDAVAELQQLGLSLSSLEENKNKFNDEMSVVYDKHKTVMTTRNDLTLNQKLLISDLTKKKSDLETKKKLLENLDGKKINKQDTECVECYGTVKAENVDKMIGKTQNEIESLTAELLQLKNPYDDVTAQLTVHIQNLTEIDSVLKQGEQRLKKLNTDISTVQTRMSQLSRLRRPEVGIQEKLIEEQILQLDEQLKQKIIESTGNSPYIQVIKDFEQELENKEKECNEKSGEMVLMAEYEEYYSFWEKGFGDQGIRKLIISDIIPALNKKTAYWLQFLIDGRIRITFDESLEEKIERNPVDGDPFVYYAMSGGERRRLNLAVSQAFAHIMMLSCGYTPSVVFLDEVTTNIDPSGVVGIYNMILELSKEKQVIITTHDHDLLDMLCGHEIIHLQKKDGITSLIDI
jgi:DNA repair exonuclease SbcCD ATPase subunit